MSQPVPPPRPWLMRFSAGLLQGLALYALYRALNASPPTWPATEAAVFAPALLVALYVPLAVLLAPGAMRRRTLMAWTLGAAGLLMLLALHDVARRSGIASFRALPSAILGAACAPLLFVAQGLVVAGDLDRRPVARYGTYFEVAWKMAVQLAFAAGFVGVFWLVMFLGAGLFDMIGLKFLMRLIEKPWFNIPVTTLALAAAIHLADVRPGILRAIRTLALLLLSWLLPLLTLLLAGFLASLPFTGLAPLWRTGSATALTLGAVALLVLMINAVHQDGAPEHIAPAVLRHATRLGALLVLPLAALAAYGLALRVGQYGWSSDRVLVAAAVLLGLIYGVGYAWAGLREVNAVEPTNVAAAWASLALVTALLSPLADPTRVAVADQVARLRDGRTAPERFDFLYLRREGHRYGQEALEALAADAATPGLRDRAIQALAEPAQGLRKFENATAAELESGLTAFPTGAPMPDGLIAYLEAKPDWRVQHCRQRSSRCTVHRLDLDRDGTDDVLLVPEQGHHGDAVALKRGKAGWTVVGTLPAKMVGCPGVREGLRAGSARAVRPALDEVEVAGARLPMIPVVPPGDCR